MMNRLLTFAGKARQRGPDYVKDLVTYHARATQYRLSLPSHRLDQSRLPGPAPRPEFHFNADNVLAIVATVPEAIRQVTILEAHQYIEQRFSFRGLPEIRFTGSIDWNLIPDGNTSWSWDLNRHRFFLTLGTAHFYSGSPARQSAFQDKLIEFWSDWMQRNSAGKGPNWDSPFEVAARLRNWVWAYFLLLASPEVSPLFLHRAWRGLSLHAAFLATHLEYHWPNNHLLLEALSLCEFAVVFREHGGERYLSLASRVLEAQVQQQVLSDGVHSELCPMYHDIAASELGAFALLCRRLGHSIPLAMEERIFSMKRFSAALRRSDRSIPLFGDSSFPDTCLRFDDNVVAGSDLPYWLYGAELSTTGSVSVSGERPLSLELFSEAGYAILQSAAQQTHLSFDFGPFSRCATANHGHSDALSFELHATGRPWIVDSGFFHPWNLHRKDPAWPNDLDASANQDWNRYFRSTVAHNTLVIDGREQNEISDHHDVGRQAKVRLNRYRSNSNEVAVSAEVEPYWSNGDAIHRREICLNATGEITIYDQIQGTNSHRLQWLLHFAADLEVELRDAATAIARRDNNALRCEVRSPGATPRLRLVRGENSPLQGWVAQSSAKVVPAWVLIAEVEGPLPYELSFHICIGGCKGELGELRDASAELQPMLPELTGAHI